MPLKPHYLDIHSYSKPHQLWKVKNGKPYVLMAHGRCLGLKAIQVQVTQWARRNHNVGAQILGVRGVLAHHGYRVTLVDGKDGKATAASLPWKVDP